MNKQKCRQRMKDEVQHMCSNLYAWCIIQLPPYPNAIIYSFQPNPSYIPKGFSSHVDK